MKQITILIFFFAQIKHFLIEKSISCSHRSFRVSDETTAIFLICIVIFLLYFCVILFILSYYIVNQISNASCGLLIVFGFRYFVVVFIGNVLWNVIIICNVVCRSWQSNFIRFKTYRIQIWTQITHIFINLAYAHKIESLRLVYNWADFLSFT